MTTNFFAVSAAHGSTGDGTDVDGYAQNKRVHAQTLLAERIGDWMADEAGLDRPVYYTTSRAKSGETLVEVTNVAARWQINEAVAAHARAQLKTAPVALTEGVYIRRADRVEQEMEVRQAA